jgi:DUF971 family protein
VSAGGTTRWPVELRLKKAEKLLEVAFDGTCFRLPAVYLRVESPSAEGQGHGPGQKTLVAGRAHVGIIELERSLRYRDQFLAYLYQLGVEREKRWRAYLDGLAANRLNREPAR